MIRVVDLNVLSLFNFQVPTRASPLAVRDTSLFPTRGWCHPEAGGVADSPEAAPGVEEADSNPAGDRDSLPGVDSCTGEEWECHHTGKKACAVTTRYLTGHFFCCCC